ncbi:tRNA-specific adenosine deaminase TAD2 [Metarhizium anisopliae]|nr:tRNA-specific adenosine deaminase TAD2 [Metarhizium anisopliae]
MPLLQSLALAPATNAVRKLFGWLVPKKENEKDGLRVPPSSDTESSLARHSPQTSPTDTDTNASRRPQPPQVTIPHTSNPDIMAVADPWLSQEDKENRPPGKDDGSDLVGPFKKVAIDSHTPASADAADTKDVEEVIEDPAVLAERAHHLRFIEEALDMARLALRTNETPVGCVLVHNGTIIAKGMNATNVTRNGTRHAEFMAISALLSEPRRNGPRQTSLRPKDLPRRLPKTPDDASDASSVESRRPDEGNEDGKKGHLYPYGQKIHPGDRISREIIRECILYVTVEPCVMCASLLRQLGIKKVYFGAVNDKFGGTGGVFSIHANSLPVREDGQTASAHPTPRPSQLPDGSGTLGTSYPPGGGDGGNVEEGYEIEGGWGRDEAVGLLRRFYVQENGRAPVPRKKEGRAARLAAMMEKDDEAGVDGPTVDGGQEQDAGLQQEDAVDASHDPNMAANGSPETQVDSAWVVA